MSTLIPEGQLRRRREAHHKELDRAVVEGRLATDIANAMKDPNLGSWYQSQGFEVVADWARLHGPDQGIITVPAKLSELLSGQVATDDHPFMVELYWTVIHEGTAEQQAVVLNPEILVSLWQDLKAEPVIAGVWESRFPQLVQTRTPQPPAFTSAHTMSDIAVQAKKRV